MLPSELLIYRQKGEEIEPKRLSLNQPTLAIASELIHLFQRSVGQPQGELNRQLQELEGEDTDYRVKRGLAHLLKSEAFSKFEVVSPLEPQLLRQRVFALSAASAPRLAATSATLSRQSIHCQYPIWIKYCQTDSRSAACNSLAS